jgi:hypothetical protein
MGKKGKIYGVCIFSIGYNRGICTKYIPKAIQSKAGR